MHLRPSSPLRAARLTLAAALVVGSAVLGAAATAAPADAAPGDCAPVDIYLNSASPVGLYRFNPKFGTVSSLPLDQVFVDITFSPDGEHLYGLNEGTLSEIDPKTGRTLEVIPIPGLSGNALAQLPGGGLIAASGSELIDVDLETRTATPDPRRLPPGYSSSGDLLVLPNSDLVVVANQSEIPGGDALVRITPEGATTVLGIVPPSYGISASGDFLYLAATTGAIYRIDELPTTGGTGAVPVTLVRAQTGTLPYGATSINESLPCNVVFSAAVSDDSTPLHQPPDLIAYGYPEGTAGEVTFRSEGRVLCTTPVTGAETRCRSADLPTGYHLVTATLSATGAVATTSYDVERVPTELVVRAEPATAPRGTPVRLTISGIPAAATGTVVLGNGDGAPFCTLTLPDTRCTVTDLPVAPYEVSAYYPGDETYAASSATTTFEVTRVPTRLAAAAERPSVTVGTADRLVASGLPAAATGTVTFTSGEETLCEVTLPALSCPTGADLPVGRYPVEARYSGDDTFLPSTATTTFAVTDLPAPEPDPTDPGPTEPGPTATTGPADPGPTTRPDTTGSSGGTTAPAPGTSGAVVDGSSATRSPVPAEGGQGLARTGGPQLAVLGVGLLAVLGGAVALLVRRRRTGGRPL